MSGQLSMVSLVGEYLSYRRQLGFELQVAGRLLLRFAEYADQTGHCGPLTTELAVRWARLPQQCSSGYLAKRLEVVRGFARYQAIFDPQTEVPPQGVLGPVRLRRTPHIYSEAELAALLTAARNLSPSTGLRPHSYATFFGLLACTGLRHSEGLKLTRSDIDWQQGVLTVRQTKFRKSRLVPLHPSATQHLRAYADARDRCHPVTLSDAFFLNSRGMPLRQHAVLRTFGKLRDQLSWSAQPGHRRPRIDDLRHSFACRRLLRWYAEGVDSDHAIAALSTYLGHVE